MRKIVGPRSGDTCYGTVSGGTADVKQIRASMENSLKDVSSSWRSRHHTRDGHEPVPCRLVVRDKTVGGLYGVAAVGSHLRLITVVHEDDVSAADLALGMCE